MDKSSRGRYKWQKDRCDGARGRHTSCDNVRNNTRFSVFVAPGLDCSSGCQTQTLCPKIFCCVPPSRVLKLANLLPARCCARLVVTPVRSMHHICLLIFACGCKLGVGTCSARRRLVQLHGLVYVDRGAGRSPRLSSFRGGEVASTRAPCPEKAWFP